MSNNQSWNNIGEEIRSAVQEALQTGDFSQLGNLGNTVSEQVNSAMKNIGRTVNDGIQMNQNRTQQMAQQTRERQRIQAQIMAEQRRVRMEAIRARAPFKPIGRVSSVLLKTFGGIWTGIFGLFSLIFFIDSFYDSSSIGFFVFFFLLLAGAVGLIAGGISQKRLLKKAQKYYNMAGNNHYINVDELAAYTNQSRKSVLKDLKKILSKGFYPEGHLDRQESCLMLDNKIYKEYLDIEKQRMAISREQILQASPMGAPVKPAETQQQEQQTVSELDAMIAEGQECIKKLRSMNDNISGEEISSKLFRLENLLKEIFDRLRDYPEQLPQMKKFMSYYLPTTLKLVAAYENFDSMSEQGKDIQDAKAEIEKTIDTINDAFVELLNRMVRETAYDVTTDAQVLQTMLAQEGLTKNKEFEALQ